MRIRVHVVALATIGSLFVTASPPAQAATPDCHPTAGGHCYSLLDAYGTTFYGLYGTWNRAKISAGGATTTNHRFINSEMWLSQSTNKSAPWVEVGMKEGYFAKPPGSVGHRVFGEWNRPGHGVGFYNFGAIYADDAVTDEFQIGRAGSTYSWRVYWDGTKPWTTGTGPGFWSSTFQQLGGEVATETGTSDLFTMYGKGLTKSGAKFNFGTDVAHEGNNTTDLYGFRPADSTWKWRVPQ